MFLEGITNAKYVDAFKKIITDVLLFDLFMTIIYLIFTYDSSHWSGEGKDDDDTLAKKAGNRFYYSTMISTTLGMGPISPTSFTAKFITTVQLYVMIGFLPLLLGK
jgi:hypothetical protein